MRGYMESMAEINHRLATGGIQSRTTVYKGITFRSHLEVKYAWHLDDIGERWRYEPRVYGPKGYGYLPDFEILGSPRPTFIEIKPLLVEVPAAEDKMSVIWDTHPTALLVVACAEGCTYFGCLSGERWETWQERWAA